jgi:hypothetical protein
MENRRLQLFNRVADRPLLGMCDACNAQFKSHLPQEEHAQWEVVTLFKRHTCKMKPKFVNPKPVHTAQQV